MTKNTNKTTDYKTPTDGTRLHSTAIGEEEKTLLKSLLAKDYSKYTKVTDFDVLGSSIALYKRSIERSDVLEYIASGELPISPQSLLALNVADEHRKEWDTNSLECRVVSSKNSFTKTLYAASKYPLPFSNREYVYERKVLTHKASMLLVSSADTLTHVPVGSKRVRVTEFNSLLVITPTSRTSCHLNILYYENPKVSVPAFILNWLTTTALPAIIRTAMEAATTYTEEQIKKMLQNVTALDLGTTLDDEGETGTANLEMYTGYDAFIKRLHNDF